jgi:hypothetical protein
MDYNMSIPEYFSERVKAFKTATSLFLSLGNSGVAVQRTWFGSVAANSMPKNLDPQGTVKSIIGADEIEEVIQLRHPDPKLVAKVDFDKLNPDLQVSGSWKKVSVPKGPAPRMGFAYWVWNGQ